MYMYLYIYLFDRLDTTTVPLPAEPTIFMSYIFIYLQYNKKTSYIFLQIK